MPQMMPMEWTMLYIKFLMTFLMFNVMNYFIQSSTKQTKKKKPINIYKMNRKW